MASWPKVICVLEWILTSFGLLGLIAFLLYIGLSIDTLAAEIHKTSPQVPIETIKAGIRLTMIIGGAIWGCSILIEIALNVLLTKGVYQVYYKYLQIWYIIQAILLGLICIGMIVSIISVVKGTEHWLALIGYSITILYRGWTIKVIRTYIVKIKKDFAHGAVYQSPSSAY